MAPSSALFCSLPLFLAPLSTLFCSPFAPGLLLPCSLASLPTQPYLALRTAVTRWVSRGVTERWEQHKVGYGIVMVPKPSQASFPRPIGSLSIYLILLSDIPLSVILKHLKPDISLSAQTSILRTEPSGSAVHAIEQLARCASRVRGERLFRDIAVAPYACTTIFT